MAFQRAFTPFLVVSLAIVLVTCRLLGEFLPLWFIPLLFIFTLFSLYVTALAYTICLRPFFSSLRHLPEAPQPPVWQRLFKEPSAHHFEKWFRDVPNDGLIRYYGILNIERVLVTSAAYAKQILQTQAYSFEKQYGQRTHLERVGGRGLVWHEGKMHKYLRRALEPAFKSGLIKDAYFTPIAQKSEEMLRLIREVLNTESPPLMALEKSNKQLSSVIELDEIVHKAVFDIMGLVAFGPEMDFQSIFRPELYYDPLEDYRLAFKPSSSNKIRVYTAFFLPTWVVNMLPIKFNFTTARAIRHFRQIGKNWISQQQSSSPSSSSSSSPPLCSTKQPPNRSSFIMEPVLRAGKLSDQDLLEQFSMLQAGGIHSTGAAIMSTLWWLAHPNNVHIQSHLRDEIRTHIPSPDPRTWSSPTIFDPCHYLNAVISEVLRLHPPFSWLGRTPTHWTDVAGTALPPGLSISISPWATHRDPTLWGDDAHLFRPSRWLSSHGSYDPSARPALLSFGAGPRKCIAETLARMELQCVLAAVFGSYEFQAIPGVALPGVTHQSTLAFRDTLKLQTTLVEGWGES